MNTLVKSIKKESTKTKTENGAVTFTTSNDKNVDLFFKIAALRGQPESRIVTIFSEAFKENKELATRILLWARDVREGAGERQIFKTILMHLEMVDQPFFIRVLNKIAELGRWDDMLVAQTTNGKKVAFDLIQKALNKEDGLCAKWMPRQGKLAVELRTHMGLTPKQWRKKLVSLTNVVETQMCSKEFDSIEYPKVPSLAMARYTKAFKKRDSERFTQYLADVNTGKSKINAAAVYPYDVLKGWNYSSLSDKERMCVQWDALPNYMTEASILPMIDVSGSMSSNCGGGKSTLTAMDVATSLGLYMATKNKGVFKDIVLTFTDIPKLLSLKGNVIDKMNQIHNHVGYNTNLEMAFTALLEKAVNNSVPQSDMPTYILILSDMEFDSFSPNETAFQNIKKQYKQAGYERPILVWWNIQARGENSPVKFDKKGNILVSGFSPAIAKNILKMDTDMISPINTMLNTILNSRYNF